jgi:hypothetical protein
LPDWIETLHGCEPGKVKITPLLEQTSIGSLVNTIVDAELIF